MCKIGWVDSHVHLTDEAFKQDLKDVLIRSREADVQRMLLVCLSFEELEEGFKLQEIDDRIDLAFGIFPTHAHELTDDVKKKMEEIVRDPRIVAIGEIGLDYYWQKEEKQHHLQQELLRYQLSLAQKVNKPVLIHSRDAAQDTVKILKDYPGQGVLHCFSYGKEVAMELVKLGYTISLAGPLTFKNARVPKEVAQAIPLENLLIETDCPYLTPEPFRGKRNEPAYVSLVGEYLSGIKEVRVNEVKKQLWKNYQNLFMKNKEDRS